MKDETLHLLIKCLVAVAIILGYFGMMTMAMYADGMKHQQCESK